MTFHKHIFADLESNLASFLSPLGINLAFMPQNVALEARLPLIVINPIALGQIQHGVRQTNGDLLEQSVHDGNATWSIGSLSAQMDVHILGPGAVTDNGIVMSGIDFISRHMLPAFVLGMKHVTGNNVTFGDFLFGASALLTSGATAVGSCFWTVPLLSPQRLELTTIETVIVNPPQISGVPS